MRSGEPSAMTSLTAGTLRRYLEAQDIRRLFIEELGWDRADGAAKTLVELDGRSIVLEPIVQKLGVPLFIHHTLAGASFPSYPERRRIEAALAKRQAEHLLVFIDDATKAQVWQWVKREPGRPAQIREHSWHPGLANVEGLRQKLSRLLFTFEEQEAGTLSVVEVTGRLQRAFDADRITRRFYDDFQKQHDALLKFLAGIPDKNFQRWYASVMLNRLMFIYFVQKKGFLDQNDNYLRSKLAESKTRFGTDAFYAKFLCPLFFDGFARPKAARTAAMNDLLGVVPYLDGGLFQKHQIEETYGKKIEVPDRAFAGLFAFFEQWSWHLDEVGGREALRTLSVKEKTERLEREINPDVLGYIFEKYVNQRQMGAYYTKEDITEYICANTILPRLLDMVKEGAKSAFEGEGSVWRLLADDPDRYIWPPVRHGIDQNLPEDIVAGIADPEGRAPWDRPADRRYALPMETWREHLDRREHGKLLRERLQAGAVTTPDTLVTLNLNIRQFVQDAIQQADETQLRSWWDALTRLTVLDPACGSGAFLFAALNILEPLYEAALDAMQAIMDDAERIQAVTGRPVGWSRYQWMRDLVEDINRHPSRAYFILKNIALNNLYGVDIMEEAAEICKLRLFLKLVAQLDNVDQIEPLPDLDFNIRAGNSLVGFSSEAELDAAVKSRLDFDDAGTLIKAEAQKADEAFRSFRSLQVVANADAQRLSEAKTTLRQALIDVARHANSWLVRQYGKDPTKTKELADWIKLNEPFNWFTEFFGVIKQGGFDVVVGNPPFLEAAEVHYSLAHFHTSDSRSVHGAFVERFASLRRAGGCLGVVLPMSVVSTKRMASVQAQLEHGSLALYSNFAWRPATLFAGVNRAISLVISRQSPAPRTLSTRYQRWSSDSRSGLLERMIYTEVPIKRISYWVPKFHSPIERELLARMIEHGVELGMYLGGSQNPIYYKSTGGLYWKVFTDFSPRFTANGKVSLSSRQQSVHCREKLQYMGVLASLSSDLFWWWYTVSSNLRDLNPSDITSFRLPKEALSDPRLSTLGHSLMQDLKKNSVTMTREQKTTGTTKVQSFRVKASKGIIDEIDNRLIEHFSLNSTYADFIRSYDLGWRTGIFSDAGADDE